LKPPLQQVLLAHLLGLLALLPELVELVPLPEPLRLPQLAPRQLL
jgi:hypothetical protein